MNPDTYMSAAEEGWAELEAWGLGYPAVSALSQVWGFPAQMTSAIRAQRSDRVLCAQRPDPVFTLFPSSHPARAPLSPSGLSSQSQQPPR